MVRKEPAASFGRRIGALALTVVLLVVTLVVGWLVWSVFEWRHGRTPSYRLLGLRVVRRSDERPIGLWRSLLRSGVCCPVLVVPTVVIGCLIGFCFAFGASPPEGLLRRPRTAPWDLLTATKVLDVRPRPSPEPGGPGEPTDLVDLLGTTTVPETRRNGHASGRPGRPLFN
jgi:RDD family